LEWTVIKYHENDCKHRNAPSAIAKKSGRGSTKYGTIGLKKFKLPETIRARKQLAVIFDVESWCQDK
jgi:hypothetical protein